MKIGISGDSLCYLPTVDEKFALIKELGYDAFDYDLSNTNQPHYKDDSLMEEYCQEVRAAAEKYDIEIFQIHGPWPTDDTTEESRKEVWEYMHRAVYACHLLNSKYVVIHPQMPFGWDLEPDADYAEELTLALIRDLLPDCEKYGVTVCLENMPFRNQRISPMKNIVAAVEKLNSPFVGVCFDTGHCNFLYDDIVENIRIAKPYLKVLHVHDNKTDADSHDIPFFGSIDWRVFSKALAQSGYDGVLSFETIGLRYGTGSEALVSTYNKLAVEVAKELARMIEEERH
ncbi:MAG: sugar phosphate isomerase/epimerase [Ruminococcaceae bacterium]|nr:sugar phosphate isomerase/epimerase [Oscillospiraceae bacterium]